MSLVGSGGHPPDFEICPKCKRKGYFYPKGLLTKNNILIKFPPTCKYCGYRRGKIIRKRM